MTTMANSARNMLEIDFSRDPAPVGLELDFGVGDTYRQIPAALPHLAALACYCIGDS
jgi:hypothetical protein